MKLLSALAVGLMLAGPVSAQDYDKGLAAWQTDDYATAFQEWRPLAEQGLASAQHSIGFMYASGYGRLKDYTEAAKWYRLAAEQGFARAQNSLGYMYKGGRGVLQDYSEAVKWYRLAAEQGNAGAQNNLGEMYDHGKGVRKDAVLAHMWFNISVTNGDSFFALEYRDEIEKRMTREQIADAQALARRCMESNYQDCG